MAYPDDEIMNRLRWLYTERTLCSWCQHPRHKPKTRGLCSSCYRLALQFWKTPTRELAIAVTIAMSEGIRNPATDPIDGLVMEQLFEDVAAAAYPWKKAIDNPFFRSANTWGENFSDAQRRLLYHEFSMISRERERHARRAIGVNVLMDMERRGEKTEIRRRILQAKKGVEEIFLK